MDLSFFHPLVAEWFTAKFGTPTEAQVLGWPAIAGGQDTLIAAPTGSGKTLAAFLYCLDRLLRAGLAGELSDETEVVYVSPLKALSNDVEKNLSRPLEELSSLAMARGLLLPPIRTAVRTGDTPAGERQKMVKRPPHVLITTPESLYILLTAEKSRKALSTVRTVIVDEIHAIAGNKRGAHLALSLERLETVAKVRPVRIGLSATQKPIDEVARFLVGSAHVDADGHPDCRVVDTMASRHIDLAIEVPAMELTSVASGEQWGEVYDRVAALVKEHRSTLVFCNTRRHVERAAHALGERLGEEQVAAHHGSLSHKIRRVAEQRLKEGDAKVVVATASLELGIDVGTVDLVVQLGSPRSLSVLVQRIGRSGHVRGGVPKGRIFAMTRDELLECAAEVRAVRAGGLDRVRVREAPLDILSQQVVAECAADEWDEDALFDRVRRAWPYHALARSDYEAVLTMLSDGVSTRTGRSSARIHRDQVNRRLKGRRGARLAAITSGGAIPDTADYAVVAEPEGIRVGTLDEDFAIESMAGDIFLLGNTSWRIRRVEAGTVRVEDAGGAPPSVPFWNGEAPGRSDEASAALSSLREEMAARLVASGDDPAPVRAWLEEACGLDPVASQQAVAYLRAARDALGMVPSQNALCAERFFDEAGGMQLVLHSPFGARINRAWGLALRKRFCRSFNFELQAAATDDGIVISLGPHHSFPLESVYEFVAADQLEEVLVQALLAAPMFTTRFRWTATRSLALLRSQGGKRVPPNLLRMRADDLLVAVFPQQAACPENLPGGDIEIPDHPLVGETVRDCLCEPLDLAGARAMLARIADGSITVHARDVTEASPFSHAILNANPYAYLDDAPLEERRTRAVMMRRSLPAAASDLGALDGQAIAQVIDDAWPEVRDADELHDLLLTLVVLPSPGEPDARQISSLAVPLDEAQVAPFYRRLEEQRRIRRLLVPFGGTPSTPNSPRAFHAAVERLPLARAAYPDALVVGDGAAAPERSVAVRAIVAGWMEFIGPVTAAGLAERLALPVLDVDVALAELEGEGAILRGRFRAGAVELEWCHRRLLARIHQLTLGRLRREIEPVSSSLLMRFLLRHQHVAPGTQLHGMFGLAEVLGQLQGVEAGAQSWEQQLLMRRIGSYDPDWLDQLCLRGEVVWGRLELRPADSDEGAPRSMLTRATPLSILRREDLAWVLAASDGARKEARASLRPVAARLFDHLAMAGASFFSDLCRSTGHLPSEIEEALKELVAVGLCTGDSFSALRRLLGEPRPSSDDAEGGSRRQAPPAWRRQRHRSAYANAPAQTSGRWSMLLVGQPDPPDPLAVREAWAIQLLRRWGVVFRDLVLRDSPLPWRELAIVYRAMEARGELRGGRFVAGFVGEQFATPEALDALRALRREEPTGELVVIGATDPLNLVGQITPGPRVAAVGKNRVLLRDGVPIASREAEMLVARAPLDPTALAAAATALRARTQAMAS